MHRLVSARVRLLDLYAPHGSGLQTFFHLPENVMPASHYIVSDVMTHTAVAIGRDAPYKEIVALMDQWIGERRPRPGGRGPCRRSRVGGGSRTDGEIEAEIRRSVRAVEGFVDVRMDLGAHEGAA